MLDNKLPNRNTLQFMLNEIYRKDYFSFSNLMPL
jgi:hypothetical protein